MERLAFALAACVAFGCHGRRVQNPIDKPHKLNNKPLPRLLGADQTSSAFNPSSLGSFRSAGLHPKLSNRHDTIARSISVLKASAEVDDSHSKVDDQSLKDVLDEEGEEFVDEDDDVEVDDEEMHGASFDRPSTLNLDKEIYTRRPEPKDDNEKPYHSKVISTMHKLYAISGMKPSGRSKGQLDPVKLQRIVKNDGGINNRTLFTILTNLREKGDWELSIALLQSVELNVRLKNKDSDEDFELEKTAAYYDTVETTMDDDFDPTAGIGEFDEEGEWTESVDYEEDEEDELEDDEEELMLNELDDDDLDFMEHIDKEEEEEDEAEASPAPKRVQTVGKNGQVVDFNNPTKTWHYNVVISTCAAAGRWHEALVLLDRMIKRKIERDARTYNVVLNTLQRARRTKLAVKVFIKMLRMEEDVEPTADTFAAVIDSCMKDRDVNQALYFTYLAFDYAERGREPYSQGFDLTKNFYVKAILACKEAGNWARAVVLFERADADGIQLSASILNSIMGAFASAGEPYAADIFLRQIYGRRGFKPDIFTYNALVSACANAHPLPNITKLREVMSEMETLAASGRKVLSPNTFTYNNLIHAYSRAGQTKEALKVLLEEMPSRRIRADKVTFTSVAAACNATGHWKDALRVTEKAEKDGVDIDTLAYSKVIDAAGRAGEWGQACSTLDTIGKRRLPHNPFVVNLALSACVDAGTADAAAAGIASLKSVLEMYARSVHSRIRHGMSKGMPSPPVVMKTVTLARELMVIAGVKETEAIEFAKQVQDATRQIKRPPFQPMKIKKTGSSRWKERGGRAAEGLDVVEKFSGASA